MSKFQKKSEKGITLLVLVITIVVILILVGVTFSSIINDNSILKQTIEAKRKAGYVEEKDKIQEIYLDYKEAVSNNENTVFSDEIKKEFGLETEIVKNEDGTYTISLENGNKHNVGIPTQNIIIEDIITSDYPVKVYGYDISLSNDIAVNIYFDISDEKFETNMEKIVITNPSRTDETREIVYNVSKDIFKTKNINNKTYYYLKYNLAPKEIADIISICAYNGQTIDSDEFTFSMADVGKAIIEDNNKDDRLKNYIISLLNYGAFSQESFNYNIENLATKKDNNQDYYKYDNEYILNAFNVKTNVEHAIIKEPESGVIYESFSTLSYFSLTINCKLPDSNFENYKVFWNGVETSFKKSTRITKMITTEKSIDYADFDKEQTIIVKDIVNNKIVGKIIVEVDDYFRENMDIENDEVKLALGALCLVQQAYLDYIK